MKKYTIKYINVKNDEFQYPGPSDGYGGSDYFTTNLDEAYKCSFLHRISLNDGEWTGLYLGIDKEDNYYLSAIGDDEVRCVINYCPMCGRKLKEA